jgi:hypothetical protein
VVVSLTTSVFFSEETRAHVFDIPKGVQSIPKYASPW